MAAGIGLRTKELPDSPVIVPPTAPAGRRMHTEGAGHVEGRKRRRRARQGQSGRRPRRQSRRRPDKEEGGGAAQEEQPGRGQGPASRRPLSLSTERSARYKAKSRNSAHTTAWNAGRPALRTWSALFPPPAGSAAPKVTRSEGLAAQTCTQRSAHQGGRAGKQVQVTANIGKKLERAKGFEPSTPTLARLCRLFAGIRRRSQSAAIPAFWPWACSRKAARIR